MTPQVRPVAGILFALLAACGYGFIPPLARLGFENGVPPPEATFFRTSLIVVVFAMVTAGLGLKVRIGRGAVGGLIAQATSTAIVSIAYLASVQFIPVGLAVIIFFTFPVLILIAAPVIERTPFGWSRLAIALLAFAGLVLAVGPSHESPDLRGIGLAAAAALAGAVQFFSGRALSGRMPPIVFGFVIHLAIWPITLVVALWWSGGVIGFFPGGGVAALGYTALVALGGVYVLTYFVQMQSLAFAPASTIAPFFNLEPVLTTFIAALLLGERLATNQYAGGALVLVALLLAGLRGKAGRMWPANRPANGTET